jgi:hypothetical protein
MSSKKQLRNNAAKVISKFLLMQKKSAKLFFNTPNYVIHKIKE